MNGEIISGCIDAGDSTDFARASPCLEITSTIFASSSPSSSVLSGAGISDFCNIKSALQC